MKRLIVLPVAMLTLLGASSAAARGFSNPYPVAQHGWCVVYSDGSQVCNYPPYPIA